MRRFFAGLWHEIALPVSLVLLLFAGAAAQFYLEIPPASAYVDEGVHTFTAASGYPTTREGHYQKKYRRYSEMHVYVVVYQAGSWRWEQDFLIEAEGKEAIQNREQVERRVLSLVDGEGYITIDGAKTVQDYVDGQKLSCWVLAGGSLAVLAAEGAVWLVVRNRKIRPGRGRDADKGDTRL